MGAALVFGITPSWTLVFVPVIVAQTVLLAYSVGLLLSGLTVVFRDIEHFIGVAMQVLFWGTPVIYDLSLVAGKVPRVARLIKINPGAGLVIAFRRVGLDGRPPSAFCLLYAAGFAL